ncbi:MAG: transposase [Deltaproteobacteria bacterium]|nr:transposase [Deltaproteobacteria bacterium]
MEAIFRHKVLRTLLAKRKITEKMIAMLSTWRHSGFHVFCGKRILPKEEMALENLARYIIRASFSQERMKCLDTESTVIYEGKNGNDRKVFDAPEWFAAMCSHVPNRGKQMVRYYSSTKRAVGWSGRSNDNGLKHAKACQIISCSGRIRHPSSYRK